MPSQETMNLAERAERHYEAHLKGPLEATHPHWFVAIEPDSGRHFLGETLSAAIQAARAAFPDRIAFALRIGHPAAVHLGAVAA